ncbi:DUF5309 family protein [Fusobacterium varium]|uniref:SU10 major capsid protein n=1 Tax=Fusobacterium varium TaxID=856 RepID=UPI0035628205
MEKKYKFMGIQVFAGGGTTGQINTTNQLISNDISDELNLINASVSPVVSHILRGGRKTPTTSTTIEWIDTYIRKTDTFLAADITDAETSLTVTHGEVLVKDSLLSVGDEVVYVTAVSGDTATITRGYGGTTAEAHTKGVEIKNMGIFMEEGGELKPSTVKLPTNIENKTGIIYEQFEVTETAKHTYIQGQSGLSAYQIESMKKKEEIMSIMENKILNSVKFTDGLKRNNDGVKALIKKHGIMVDAEGTELTKAFFDKVVKQIIDAGGGNDLAAGKYFVIAPYDQVNRIDNFNKETIRTSQDERVTGTKITQIVTTGGTLNVFHANSLNANEMGIMNLEELEMKELYPFKEELGAKTSLSEKYFIHGEFTVKLGKCPCQMWVKNLKK